jgi:putative transposase
MNMLRAGAVRHPAEWKTCGYHELAGFRERKLVVNRERLLSCLRHEGDYDGFVDWYRKTIDQMADSMVPGRDPLWTESVAVGDMGWIESLGGSHVIGRKKIAGLREEDPVVVPCVRESPASYGLKVSERFRNGFAFSKN